MYGEVKRGGMFLQSVSVTWNALAMAFRSTSGGRADSSLSWNCSNISFSAQNIQQSSRHACPTKSLKLRLNTSRCQRTWTAEFMKQLFSPGLLSKPLLGMITDRRNGPPFVDLTRVIFGLLVWEYSPTVATIWNHTFNDFQDDLELGWLCGSTIGIFQSSFICTLKKKLNPYPFKVSK